MSSRILSAWQKLDDALNRGPREERPASRLLSVKRVNARRVATATAPSTAAARPSSAVRIRTAKVVTPAFTEKVSSFPKQFISELFQETQKFTSEEQNRDPNISDQKYRYFVERFMKKSTLKSLDVSDFNLFAPAAAILLNFLHSHPVQRLVLARNPLGDQGLITVMEGMRSVTEVV